VALLVYSFGPPEGRRKGHTSGSDGYPDEEALTLPEEVEADADPDEVADAFVIDPDPDNEAEVEADPEDADPEEDSSDEEDAEDEEVPEEREDDDYLCVSNARLNLCVTEPLEGLAPPEQAWPTGRSRIGLA
jgi:hypothetical protein